MLLRASSEPFRPSWLVARELGQPVRPRHGERAQWTGRFPAPLRGFQEVPVSPELCHELAHFRSELGVSCEKGQRKAVTTPRYLVLRRPVLEEI